MLPFSPPSLFRVYDNSERGVFQQKIDPWGEKKMFRFDGRAYSFLHKRLGENNQQENMVMQIEGYPPNATPGNKALIRD